LTRNIIGTIGEVDTYRLPDAKGFTSMQRHLIGDSDAARQKMREEILSTTAADIREFGDAMAEVAAKGRIAVIGSEQAIEGANKGAPGAVAGSGGLKGSGGLTGRINRKLSRRSLQTADYLFG